MNDVVGPPHTVPVAALPVQCSTMIAEVSTPQRVSRRSARSWVSRNRWEQWARAPTMPWPNRSTRHSKRETLQGAARWESPRAARLAVFRWITRYNTRRRHSYCDYLSPADYETTHAPTNIAQAA